MQKSFNFNIRHSVGVPHFESVAHLVTLSLLRHPVGSAAQFIIVIVDILARPNG
jgi:hypothetical protein